MQAKIADIANSTLARIWLNGLQDVPRNVNTLHAQLAHLFQMEGAVGCCSQRKE